jgi:hypothetical protein
MKFVLDDEPQIKQVYNVEFNIWEEVVTWCGTVDGRCFCVGFVNESNRPIEQVKNETRLHAIDAFERCIEKLEREIKCNKKN